MPSTFQRNACASVALSDTCGILTISARAALVLSANRTSRLRVTSGVVAFIYCTWLIPTQHNSSIDIQKTYLHYIIGRRTSYGRFKEYHLENCVALCGVPYRKEVFRISWLKS